jgi:hypothetical protein
MLSLDLIARRTAGKSTRSPSTGSLCAKIDEMARMTFNKTIQIAIFLRTLSGRLAVRF